MKVLLVHNPSAGDDDHSGEHLVELIESAGHSVEYRTSKSGWMAGLDRSPQLVVVAGGDGTVSEVARAASHRGIPVTILPAGTANNIAGALGLQGLPHPALVAGWANGKLKPFDIGVAHGAWGESEFLESVGIGALATLMKETDHGEASHVNELKEREERIAAATDVLICVLEKQGAIECEISIDGRRREGCYVLVEVLNFGAAGPGVRLSPHADGGDGKLDVVIVEEHERDTLIRALQQGTDRSPAPWTIHHGQHVYIRFDEQSTLHLDDELLGAERARGEVTVRIRPRAVTFVVPGG